jgi:hypothetical protein
MTLEQKILDVLHTNVDEHFVADEALTKRKQRPVFTTADLNAEYIENMVHVTQKDGTAVQKLFIPNDVVTTQATNDALREAKRQLMLACENLRQVIAGENAAALAKAKQRITAATQSLNAITELS